MFEKTEKLIFSEKSFSGCDEKRRYIIEEKKLKKVLDKNGFSGYNNTRCQRDSDGNERSLKTI